MQGHARSIYDGSGRYRSMDPWFDSTQMPPHYINYVPSIRWYENKNEKFLAFSESNLDAILMNLHIFQFSY